ncbi:class I SAM-dependent methyltransferase [Flavobacteriaceae bacterium]|nr:class I SAM-dependent methyltransferase [Flavobacteriaceae bacterium]
MDTQNFDDFTFDLSRKHIKDFIEKNANILNPNGFKKQLLEIGPQGRLDVKELFNNYTYSSLDIDSSNNPDILGDITKTNKEIKDNFFDCIICLEVLEHTLNPFDAIRELKRILKIGGFLLISAPLNWRIHGPIPDCWRFTEFGWKVLLKDFQLIEMDKLDTPERPLFPIRYNFVVKKNSNEEIDSNDIIFKKLKYE